MGTRGGPRVLLIRSSVSWLDSPSGGPEKLTPASLAGSYFNLMIFLVPVAWALHLTHQNDVVVFVFCFLSVIPLANLLSFATEQLALRVGEAVGGLLNASFGNAVEVCRALRFRCISIANLVCVLRFAFTPPQLLISILALVKGDIALVQASMIGSILSNTLLVLGMCYFAGGLRFHEQLYQVAASQLQISLLGISIAAIILPAGESFAFAAWVWNVLTFFGVSVSLCD